MIDRLVIATGNRHKFVEFRDMLRPYGVDVLFGRELCPALDVEETGATFEENARLKAQAWAKAAGMPALADDSGLEVRALDWRPGIFSARYADTDAACRARLLEEMKGQTDRYARFVCALCLSGPDGEVLFECQGLCEGTILQAEEGSGDFGYDPLFLPKGGDRSFAALSRGEKAALSHRGLAMARLLTFFKD